MFDVRPSPLPLPLLPSRYFAWFAVGRMLKVASWKMRVSRQKQTAGLPAETGGWFDVEMHVCKPNVANIGKGIRLLAAGKIPLCFPVFPRFVSAARAGRPRLAHFTFFPCSGASMTAAPHLLPPEDNPSPISTTIFRVNSRPFAVQKILIFPRTSHFMKSP